MYTFNLMIYLYILLDNSNIPLVLVVIVYMKHQLDKDISGNHPAFHDVLDHSIQVNNVRSYHLLYDVDRHIYPFPHRTKMNDCNNGMEHNLQMVHQMMVVDDIQQHNIHIVLRNNLVDRVNMIRHYPRERDRWTE